MYYHTPLHEASDPMVALLQFHSAAYRCYWYRMWESAFGALFIDTMGFLCFV